MYSACTGDTFPPRSAFISMAIPRYWGFIGDGVKMSKSGTPFSNPSSLSLYFSMGPVFAPLHGAQNSSSFLRRYRTTSLWALASMIYSPVSSVYERSCKLMDPSSGRGSYTPCGNARDCAVPLPGNGLARNACPPR